jgi:hypothetical protein
MSDQDVMILMMMMDPHYLKLKKEKEINTSSWMKEYTLIQSHENWV